MADGDRFVDGTDSVGNRIIPKTGQVYDQDGNLVNIETMLGIGDGVPGPKPETDFGKNFYDGSESAMNRIVPESGKYYGEDGLIQPIEKILDALGGEGGGGVTSHNSLSGRNAANCHPISAITGLDSELYKIKVALTGAQVEVMTVEELMANDVNTMTPHAILVMLSKVLNPI